MPASHARQSWRGLQHQRNTPDCVSVSNKRGGALKLHLSSQLAGVPLVLLVVEEVGEEGVGAASPACAVTTGNSGFAASKPVTQQQACGAYQTRVVVCACMPFHASTCMYLSPVSPCMLLSAHSCLLHLPCCAAAGCSYCIVLDTQCEWPAAAA